jgi:site-specific DNA-cytosine methylase
MTTKRLLELFCGTKSVGDVFQNAGYEVTSLDYNKKFNATHTEDILTWDYTIYPKDRFDVIWASPDCTTWSLATGGKYRLKASIFGLNNVHQERATMGNNMILRVIEILKYFSPRTWFIENPRGLLIHYPPLQDFINEYNGYNTLVYYANYNNWGFPKPTHIWSNVPLWDKEIKPEMPDDSYFTKYHVFNQAPKRYYKTYWKGNAEARSKIPPDLIHRLRLLIENEV